MEPVGTFEGVDILSVHPAEKNFNRYFFTKNGDAFHQIMVTELDGYSASIDAKVVKIAADLSDDEKRALMALVTARKIPLLVKQKDALKVRRK
jgi:hypothetical protein